MSKSIVLDVTNTEVIAILNALNYFGYGCSASECSTLLGVDQDAVHELFQKISEVQRQTEGPAEEV